MDRSRETTSSDGNVTTSTLTFIPRMEDLGTDLSCRANNTYMPGSARQDTWTLNIHYGPLVTLELGSNLNASSIREGVDVYFECIIRANPWIYKIVWRHNGRPLQNNASAGTILSNQTLVLQSVNRNSSGLYTCVASNSEGDSESNPFNLDVKYEPICSAVQQRVYGAARLEEIQVICDVDANPPATLFRWLFNNSAVQTVEVGSVSSVPGGGRSIASYTPQSEQEYGTLLCWGRNELGAQIVPCVFHIVPAGKPDPPRNCKVLNRTSSSLQVACSRGFDGGLPQEFTMELHATSVLGSGHRRLVSNVTSRTKPEFTVTGLESGSSYIMSVYSTNGKGRSLETVSLKATTLKTTHQEHRKTATGSRAQPAFPQMAPVLWVLAGIVGTLILVSIVVVVLLRTKGLRCDCCDGDEDERQSNGDSPGSDKGLTVAMQGQGLKSPGITSTALQTEDSGDNPDVIPHTNDIEYPSTVYKPLERNNIGTSTRMLNMDSPSQTVLYGNLQGFSRAPTTESMLSYENQSVRWQQVTWRDIGVQAEPPGSPTVLQPVLKTPEQMAMLKLNAETQTPLLVRHKESAV